MNKLYTFVGVLGAAAAAVWIVPAWIATGIFASGVKVKRLVAN